MPSPSQRSAVQIAIVLLGIALTVPPIAHAECVTVTPLKGEKSTGRVAKPTLVFRGTVTSTDREKYLVSFNVDRVWQGQLRRETTFFVVPVIEGSGVGSFQPGSAYLVTTYAPVNVFGPPEDVAATGLLSGTVGIGFGCLGGPVPLADASQELKRLGPGRPPRR
jgi:hypothetical protein